MILTNGYYKSNVIIREEMHAGGHIVSKLFIIYSFNAEGDFYSLTKKKDESFKGKKELIARKYDKYEVLGDNLVLCYSCYSDIERKHNFKIKSSELFLDKFGNKYHFHPWEEE